MKEIFGSRLDIHCIILVTPYPARLKCPNIIFIFWPHLDSLPQLCHSFVTLLQQLCGIWFLCFSKTLRLFFPWWATLIKHCVIKSFTQAVGQFLYWYQCNRKTKKKENNRSSTTVTHHSENNRVLIWVSRQFQAHCLLHPFTLHALGMLVPL